MQDWMCWGVLSALANVAPDNMPPPPPDMAEHVSLVSLKKGQRVFSEGQAHPYIHVVRQGCVKTFYADADGKVWIQDFFGQGAFLCSLTSLSPGGVASYNCEALEDTTLERIDYPWLEACAGTHPVWMQALLWGWKDYATRREMRERHLLTLSPTDRYKQFTAQHPLLAQRVPQQELARYFGITAVSLSRIRARLRQGGAT